jgi:phage major head subunit gpT-like protein
MKREAATKILRESILKMINVDIFDKKACPFEDPSFNLKKLRESVSSSQYPQLLRAGLQMATNNLIEINTDTTFEQWGHTINSDKETELYAPIHGISFMSERGESQKFSETQTAGLDLSLTNRNFGQILAVNQNLMDDDQSGQLSQLAAELSEYSRLRDEVWAYGKLNSGSAGQSYAGLKIPSSETKPSTEANYPWTLSSAPFVGGGWNKLAPQILSQAGIVAAYLQMKVQKNLLGLIMQVTPGALITSPFYKFQAMVLMQSTLNPSSSSTQTADIGKTGSIESVNPIKSILDIIDSPYVFDDTGMAGTLSKAWYVVDTKKPWFINQVRQAPSVIMENPDSGESFNRKVERHRLDIRGNSDFVDPRFAIQGSDGSV